MRHYFHFVLVLLALPLMARGNAGELRLNVTDPRGLGIKTAVELINEASEYRNTFLTDDAGLLVAKRLPFGMYRVRIAPAGFAEYSGIVEIQSEIPVEQSIQLGLPSVETSITVHDSDTLIDPSRAGSSHTIGTATIETRTASLPGRSLQDLVDSQPGWLYEGNAVLHPRGSEYQTQFVVNGIPLADNRSPSFGPAMDADDVKSMTIYTAGIPAEYGRKMGGVVEVNTLRDIRPGLHGDVVVSGGSFDTAGSFADAEYGWGHNAIGASASGSMTAHYLNPVVPENYTNRGTVGDFSVAFERDLTPNDHLTVSARHELARYQIPNEMVQQNGAYLPNAGNSVGCAPVPPDQQPGDCVFIPGGQLQTAANFETMGSASLQHVFSSNAISWLRGMARDNSRDFYSNPSSWPLIATQHNDFRELYFNGSASWHRHRHEWKAGFESDAIFLHENFNYLMPDCTNLSNPQCPITLGILNAGTTTFAFLGSRPDLEQSAYVQDAIELGKWSVNAGLRWDHYQLLVNQNAISPRVAVSRYFPSAGLLVHISYDRVFQTPSFENILLASNPAAEALDTSVPALQLPVQPSHGNYYEVGATKALAGKVRLDANIFRRDINNYADDSQILSTSISFPIAFRKAILYGAEAKVDLPQWRRFSGFASYSYIVGNVWNPVTGGLFLGDDATGAATPLAGHFPDSQDQRNTMRARIRYQVVPRLWISLGSDYNSGLPFQPDLTPAQYATEYGEAVISHLNFARNRISPYLTENISVGVDLYKHEKRSLRLQGDVENLSNELEVLDFGGLFSGNSLGPSRTYAVRLQATF